MTETMRCPSCTMTAQRQDHHQWVPLLSELDDWRRCRNCGADVELGALAPHRPHRR